MKIKEALPILAKATKKNDAIYGQLLHSDKESIATSSYSAYCRFNIPLQFTGDVEFNLIQQYLKLEDIEIKASDKILNIKSGNSVSKLNIHSMNFPFQYKPKLKNYIIITQDLLSTMIDVSIFCGADKSFIYMCKDYLFAGSNSSIIKYNMELDIPVPMYFSKEYISILRGGCKVSQIKNIVYVEYDNGFFCFVPKKYKYSLDSVVAQIDTCEDAEFLCNIASIKAHLPEIERIFTNELEKSIKIVSTDRKLKLVGESYLNGTVFADIDVETEVDCNFEIDLSTLKKISIDYDLYIPKVDNRVLFKSTVNDSQIFCIVTED